MNILCLDANGSNSAQESSSDKESNDSSDDFSATESSTSKTMAQYKAFYVQKVPEEVFEQGHIFD